MARMIPADGPSLTESSAERDLYWIFKKQLGDDFVVIHSVPWLTDVASRGWTGAARTGEVDFLILHPEYGVLAVEVKGGRHKISGHYYVHVLSGRRVSVIKQARDNAHGISRWFDPALDIRGRIGYAVALPDSSLDRKLLPPALRGGHEGSNDDILLLMDDLPRVGERVREIMEQWCVRLNKGPLGQWRLDRIVELVSPSDEGDSIWRARVYGRDEYWLKLTEQQTACLDRINGSARQVVLGWPGTGKTVLAVETAKRAALQNQSCLFLTYNKLIASSIRTQLVDIQLCEVRHFHDLLKQIRGTSAVAMEGQNEEAILRHAANKGAFARWDILIVDEAQALAESWHQVLAEAFKGKKVCVFCDDIQRFEFEQGTSSAQLCQVYQTPSAFQLTHCLRNPHQISSVLQEMMPPSLQLVCPRPADLSSLEEVVAGELGEGLERQLNALLARGIEPKDIVVLHAYGCPQAVADVLSTPRFVGIVSHNIAAFRGMESRIVVCVIDGWLQNDLQIFSAYSRTTSHCVAIYEYRMLREAQSRSGKGSRHVRSVASRLSAKVKSISDEMVGAYRLGILDSARKLDICTADVYWHSGLRCWIVGQRDGEPAGYFWEDQLVQYEWNVIVLNRTEQTPYIYSGRQSLDRREDVKSAWLDFAECEQCVAETHHGDGDFGCLSCAARGLPDVSQSLFAQLEIYDRQIMDIVTRRVEVGRAAGLPISLVALAIAQLTAAKHGAYPAKLLVNSGTRGYNAARVILWAYIGLARVSEISRLEFSKRVFPYVEACPAPLTFEQWKSVVARAFNQAVIQGLLMKPQRQDIYTVADRAEDLAKSAEKPDAESPPG